MKYPKQRFIAVAAGIGLAVTSGSPRLMAGTAIDPDAARIFKASCKYLADAKSLCVKVEVWKDVVLPNGQKLQTTRNLDVQLARPNRLHIEVRSPRDSRGFWLQDRALTMLDRKLNLYGVMDVPERIDAAFDAVEERFGIEIPLADVLVSDPYANLMESVDSAADLGKVTVLGTVCNHLAFTGPNADCQIWIPEGPKPLPRKIVINFKNNVGSPQVTQIFSDWDLVSPVAESVFNFVAPEGAGRIVVNPKAPEIDVDDATPPAQ